MGAYILTTFLVFWIVTAFAVGGFLVNDAVDAYGNADPVYGNLAFHLFWLTIACIIALPRIIFDAITHHIFITLRRNHQ